MYPNKEVRREGLLQGQQNLSRSLRPVLAPTRESKSQEHEPAVLEKRRIGGCVAQSDLSLYATLPATTVSSAFPVRSWRGGSSTGSTESATKSASMPGRSM